MKILMVGDIVGSPGRTMFARVATRMKETGAADFVIANAENSAGGRGVTARLADELLAGGADVLTLGDHTWDQKDIVATLETSDRVLRPANFAPGCPGRGHTTVDANGTPVMVINAIGRVFMNAYDCPFRTLDGLLSRADRATVAIVDLHAEATSEKIVMGRYLDGRVSAVAGTHTHVQTSDERVLPGGTGYMTDLGMTGARDSALGRDLASVTSMFLTGRHEPFKTARDDVVLEGLLVDVDTASGKARKVRRIRECDGDGKETGAA